MSGAGDDYSGSDDYSALNDADLALACAARPPRREAWDILYKRFRSLVEAKIRRLSGAASDAEAQELRQETFLRVFVSLPNYDFSRGSLAAFILRIASSVVIDAWRHSRREREASVSLEERPLSALEEAADNHFSSEMVESIARAAADSFPDPLHRRIAHLVLDHESGPAISAKLGAKRHVVYEIRHRLDREIRASLERSRGDPG